MQTASAPLLHEMCQTSLHHNETVRDLREEKIPTFIYLSFAQTSHLKSLFDTWYKISSFCWSGSEIIQILLLDELCQITENTSPLFWHLFKFLLRWRMNCSRKSIQFTRFNKSIVIAILNHFSVTIGFAWACKNPWQLQWLHCSRTHAHTQLEMRIWNDNNSVYYLSVCTVTISVVLQMM